MSHAWTSDLIMCWWSTIIYIAMVLIVWMRQLPDIKWSISLSILCIWLFNIYLYQNPFETCYNTLNINSTYAWYITHTSSELETNQNFDIVIEINKNNFDYEHVIGRGGFGKVWKVVYRKEKKLYAMKEMAKARIISKRSVNSVMNEKKFLC